MLLASAFSPQSILYPLQVSTLVRNLTRLSISPRFFNELQIEANLNARWYLATARWICLNLSGHQVCLRELLIGSKTTCQNPSSKLFRCTSPLKISCLVELRSREQGILEMIETKHLFNCLRMNLLQPQSHFW